MNLLPGPFLDVSSEEECEFESADESAELNVGQDQGLERATLIAVSAGLIGRVTG